MTECPISGLSFYFISFVFLFALNWISFVYFERLQNDGIQSNETKTLDFCNIFKCLRLGLIDGSLGRFDSLPLVNSLPSLSRAERQFSKAPDTYFFGIEFFNSLKQPEFRIKIIFIWDLCIRYVPVRRYSNLLMNTSVFTKYSNSIWKSRVGYQKRYLNR